ncbi:hypothetical protein ACI2UK_13405 [Ralstonia nicotianae]|uniref:hypothetical protein n=1 Tax=Ralstonia pseudosolanacearum TaxID=1310165 RepID=UPI00200517FE|nr:hypothetical protein [Ralstonia pseudosolanacearum]MCK4118458.1 hypothetical protein [Ralstonia pseudosolanacearum]
MQTKHRGRRSAPLLLCSVLFIVFSCITAIAMLAQKHAVAGIDCLPDSRLALLVRFGIGGVVLFVEVCCIAALLAVCFARRGRAQRIDTGSAGSPAKRWR